MGACLQEWMVFSVLILPLVDSVFLQPNSNFACHNLLHLRRDVVGNGRHSSSVSLLSKSGHEYRFYTNPCTRTLTLRLAPIEKSLSCTRAILFAVTTVSAFRFLRLQLPYSSRGYDVALLLSQGA